MSCRVCMNKIIINEYDVEFYSANGRERERERERIAEHFNKQSNKETDFFMMQTRNKSVNEYEDTHNNERKHTQNQRQERESENKRSATKQINFSSSFSSVQLIYVNVQCWWFVLLVVSFVLLLLFLSCLDRMCENEITHRRMIEADTALICVNRFYFYFHLFGIDARKPIARTTLTTKKIQKRF